MEKARQSISDLSRLVVAALIASLLVVIAPFQAPSQADYTSVSQGTITINDRVCNLGDPNDHSTSATAFEITNSDQLWEVTDCVSSSATIYFKLGNDIDVSEATVSTASPIGFSTSSTIYSFSGVLDGQNREISGISMSSATNGVGLFAFLHSATVSNLALHGQFYTSVNAGGSSNRAGALAVKSDGLISITSITNHANVSADRGAGGLVGYVVGDLAVFGSRNFGEITSRIGNLGGLAGYADGNVTIEASMNEGPISSSDGTTIGGFVGGLNGTLEIRGSENKASVSGYDNVGGHVGLTFGDVEIEGSTNSGPVHVNDTYVGGFAGAAYGTFFSASNSINSATISAVGDYAGGFVGEADILLLNRVINSGSISTSGGLTGGLAGSFYGPSAISNSYNAGAISALGAFVGGLVGETYNSSSTLSIYQSGNLAAVQVQDDYVGGLVGGAYGDVSFDRVFNTGRVGGAYYTGGFVGEMDANLTISESFGAAPVSGGSDVDGLAGTASGTVSTASTYIFAASRYFSSTPVIDLKKASTFVGFDFDNVWGFGACTLNGGFPVIRSLGLANTYFASECSNGSSGSTPSLNDASIPAAAYEGPEVRSSATTQIAGSASYEGRRLDTVTKVMAGGQELTIRSATSQSLQLQLPAGLGSGLYDLVLLSSYGTLTFQQGLRVVASEAAVEPEETETPADGPILTAGSFKGYVAIYTKGYEGQRLSAKVAGKWLVVPELTEFWRGNNYSRTVRFTGAGRTITVDLYIDRKFVKSVQLVTK